MKYLYILAATIAFLLLTASCDDFLDRLPYGETRIQDVPEDDLEAMSAGALFDAYAHMRQMGVSGRPLISMYSIIADDADKGSLPTDGGPHIQMEAFTFSPNGNLFINSAYTTNLEGVAKSNKAIHYIDSLYTKSEKEAEKQGLIAESRFLRGFYYYNLARLYGGMQLLEKRLTVDDPIPPRSTLQETYDFIEKDFKFAIDCPLPSKSEWGMKWAGRATKGAAQAYLAKLYMLQNRWSEIYSLTSEIISSGEYDLNTPYDKIFREEYENCSESVFEIQAETNLYTDAKTEFAQIQGVRSVDLDLGWGFNVPSAKLLDEYEEGDPRKEATVLVRGTTMDDGTFIPESAANLYYNKKVYIRANERAAHPDKQGGWVNVRLVRYAEIVLIHAEACNELGKTQEALDALEMVRARARGNNNAVLPKVTVTSKQDIFNAIVHERRIELALEFERYPDLLRWNQAETVLAPKWKRGKHEFFPIPQTEIDKGGKNENGENIIKQNPGY